MIKGKRLTIQQCKVLKRNKIIDYENWVYIKTEVVDSNGNKCTSRFRDKEMYMIIRNKNTNEEKRCLC